MPIKDAAIMIRIASFFLIATLVVSCSSPRPQTPAPGLAEYDLASGTWQPTTRVVVPPPTEDTTTKPVVKKSGDSAITRVGNTLKKPLAWLPWHKDEAPPQEAAR